MSEAKKTVGKAKAAPATQEAEIVVYIGPDIPGAKQYTTYNAGLPDALKEKIVEHRVFELDKVRFRAPVRPGDTVTTRCRIVRNKSVFYFCEGEVKTGDTVCLRAEFSFALVPATGEGDA